MDVTYEQALENVLGIGLLVAVAHRNKDITSLYALLNEFVDAYDLFNEVVDQLPEDDDEDDEEEGDYSVNLYGQPVRK